MTPQNGNTGQKPDTLSGPDYGVTTGDFGKKPDTGQNARAGRFFKLVRLSGLLPNSRAGITESGPDKHVRLLSGLSGF